MKSPLISPVVLLAYAIAVAVGIEAINSAWGNLLPNQNPPQEGSGYGKMRGAMGEFQMVCLLLGTPVYPACLLAAFTLAGYFREAKTKERQWLALFGIAVSAVILARFCFLGVFSAGTGLE